MVQVLVSPIDKSRLRVEYPDLSNLNYFPSDEYYSRFSKYCPLSVKSKCIPDKKSFGDIHCPYLVGFYCGDNSYIICNYKSCVQLSLF